MIPGIAKVMTSSDSKMVVVGTYFESLLITSGFILENYVYKPFTYPEVAVN